MTNDQSQHTVILIPCYNEAHRLNFQAFDEFLKKHGDGALHLYFIDDGSTDKTHELLEEWCARFPQVTSLLKLPENKGKGEAVRQGFLKAMDSHPKYIGFLDADLSTPLDAMLELQEVLNTSEYMLAMGSRVLMMGRVIRRNAVRHYIGRVFATMASLTLKLPVYDTQCGAKLFRNTDQLSMVMRQEFLSRWLFDIEILKRLAALNEGTIYDPKQKIICEYPLKQWCDTAGTKVTLWDGLRAFIELARIRWAYAKFLNNKEYRPSK